MFLNQLGKNKDNSNKTKFIYIYMYIGCPKINVRFELNIEENF